MTNTDELQTLNAGSRWYRWEPHIHAPGTVLNDQFKGPNAWNDYLNEIESASPQIAALGVTDYYSTEVYERVADEKLKNGRLQSCQLIFPNIEMRLGIGTTKGRWVNIHLLVYPTDPAHLEEVHRFLQHITFEAHNDTYRCNKSDLIKLGGRVDPKLVAQPEAALKLGSEQFKVSLDDLRSAFKASAWARENILVAVAGSETDGTSGVRQAADATLRQEIERFANIIFASSAAQRDYWLGRKTSEADIIERYGALKPCMHGSDAHETGKIGKPDGDRFSWIKGEPAFDTLRQACIDPAGRAFVGSEPPVSATPSQVISGVEIVDAPWAATPKLALNPGLVAIIGARGSGKTALADIIARGCSATSEKLSDSSFLSRAAELLAGSSVLLQWQEGAQATRMLDDSDEWAAEEYPKARYLSQKFVEELCSSTGMTDALLSEIERVVFESHPLGDRDGAADFEELRDIRTSRFREAREREEESLAWLSERIGTDIEKNRLVDGLKKQVDAKAKLIEGYEKDRGKLAPKGSGASMQYLNEVTAAAETVRGYLRFYSLREQDLLSLQDEVTRLREHGAAEELRRMSDRHKASALKPDDWKEFLIDYKGDVDATLKRGLEDAQKQQKSWRGTVPKPPENIQDSLIGKGATLTKQPLALLQAEIERAQKALNVDQETATKFAAISKRISEETTAHQRLKERYEDCQGAAERVREAQTARETGYRRVFEAITSEEAVLKALYSPLMQRLEASEGTLNKLAFSVTRTVDVEAWAASGEKLLDLRRQGAFRGKGALQQAADEILRPAWETGDPQAVAEAMTAFRTKHQKDLLEHAVVPKSEQATYREWAKNFAKWLFSTDHIVLQYSIDYDGVDIRKLSPGTRGIVLLLLYLALDDADDRPLIIDQPEENLDPKSIFDELVGLFLKAKSKRQVIMVTHNANLVVNTDADQVIVAHAGLHAAGQLPTITYTSGGLETSGIRKAVCDILEGGERAFKERARRLRVALER